MSSDKDELRPDEQVLLKRRPAWRSFWVFFFGLLLCGIAPFTQDNPPLSPESGILFAAVFAIIILRRWSNLYTLTDQRIMVRGGLFYKDTSSIALADITTVEANQGINLRLVGCGHIMVRSRLPHQETLIVYGFPAPFEFRDRLEQLAEKARNRQGRMDSAGNDA